MNELLALIITVFHWTLRVHYQSVWFAKKHGFTLGYQTHPTYTVFVVYILKTWSYLVYFVILRSPMVSSHFH